MTKLKVFFIFLITLSLSTNAKLFTSEFMEFQLPNGWSCEMEGSEWVCQSQNKDRKKEAIIILAAKLRGPQDNLADYQAYLKQAKSFKLPGGKKQNSEPKYAQVKTISGHKWIDSLHLASEVPGFYTRYLATVKGDLGVLITFSVSKDHHSAYQKVFDKIIETLKVFAQMKPDARRFVRKKSSGDSLPGEAGFVENEGDLFDLSVAKQAKKKKGKSGGQNDLIFYIIIAVVAGLVLMKMKKGKKKKKKKKSKKSKSKKSE